MIGFKRFERHSAPTQVFANIYQDFRGFITLFRNNFPLLQLKNEKICIFYRKILGLVVEARKARFGKRDERIFGEQARSTDN